MPQSPDPEREPSNTANAISRWRRRWEAYPTRVKEMIACLKADPPEQVGIRVARLAWYTKKNGFSVLTVSPTHPAPILDLRGILLRQADLENAILSFALFDEADLAGANLKGANLSWAVLTNANLHETNLEGATLVAAHLEDADLTLANLVKANLSRSYLHGADLGWAQLRQANFTLARMDGVSLEKAGADKADFSGASLKGANFSMAQCQQASFFKSNLSGAKFILGHLEEASFVQANLEEADLSLSYLNGADLTSARLRNADLSRAHLTEANLVSADLREAKALSADLTGARLKQVNLEGTNLKGSCLEKADLSRACLSGADLSGASLLEANLRGADLHGAELTQCDLRSISRSPTVDSFTRFGNNAPHQAAESEAKGRENPSGSLSDWIFPPLSQMNQTDRQDFDADAARRLCNQIRMLYRDNGLFRESATYFEQENYWQTRNDKKQGRRYRYLSRLLFFEYFTGYGEKPHRIALTGLITIVLFSLLYWLGGVEADGQVFRFKGFLPVNALIVGFWSCLLFSIQNFATLGSGMFKPGSGWSNALAALEGLLGFFIITLAIVTFVRKAVRD